MTMSQLWRYDIYTNSITEYTFFFETKWWCEARVMRIVLARVDKFGWSEVEWLVLSLVSLPIYGVASEYP